ncbi:MAG: hypothetical protein V5A68_06260 [Candidatus Thermoplasmatota archaeon]
MEKNSLEDNANYPLKFIWMLFSSFPSLMFRLGGNFLRFKRNAKKGGKIFKKELLDQGIDKSVAEGLTREYLEGSRFFKYLT